MIKVLLAASEAVPFIKTGGLADVIGSLPKYTNKENYDVRVILPKYACLNEELSKKLKYITHFYMEMNWRSQYVGVFETTYDNIHFYFVDNEYYFSGPTCYTNDNKWDIERFIYYSRAVLSLLPVIDFKPDIIHCNDWQTGLIPVYLKDKFQNNEFYQGMKTVMTIHNLKFQGVWDVESIADFSGLSSYYFTPDKLEAYKDGNCLKGGLVYADAITTVSPTYAEEIKNSFFGEGLEGLLRARSNSLRGILNGIDYDEYNPKTDKYLAKNYDIKNFRKFKIKNKKELQKRFNLDQDDKTMLIGIVSRLTSQKGFDLIDRVMDDLCRFDDIQIIVLGTGEERYENMFKHYEWKYYQKVSAQIYYSEEVAHLIYSGCDAFLMPSLFEPCGLSQLMALRYGSVPIVRETGGLKDTVEPYNEYESTGTGFSFANYNAHEMLGTIRYAENIYYNKKREWNKIIDRGMSTDFSWERSAKSYEEMYYWLANNG